MLVVLGLVGISLSSWIPWEVVCEAQSAWSLTCNTSSGILGPARTVILGQRHEFLLTHDGNKNFCLLLFLVPLTESLLWPWS